MTKTLIVKINKNSFKENYALEYIDDYQHQQDFQKENDKTERIYGMALPSEVQLDLLPQLVEKMKNVEKFCEDNDLSKIQFLSGFSRDPQCSHAYLLKEGNRIEPSFYTELGMTQARPAFDEQCFTIIYDWLHKGFQLKFYYTTGYCEFLFESYFFQLD